MTLPLIPGVDPGAQKQRALLNAVLTARGTEILGLRESGTDIYLRFRASPTVPKVKVHVQSTAAGQGGLAAYDSANFFSSTTYDCRDDRVQDVTISGITTTERYAVFLIPIQEDGAGTAVQFDGAGGRPDNMSFWGEQRATLPLPHVLATTAALGPEHTVSGLTARQVLIATGALTALFRALTAADVAGATAAERTFASSSEYTFPGPLRVSGLISADGNLAVPGAVSPAIGFGGFAVTDVALRKDAAGKLGVVLGDNTAYAPVQMAALTATTGNFSGLLTASAGLIAVSTTAPQASVRYDGSNRLDVSVSSAGAVTFDAVGASAGHNFSDALTITTGSSPGLKVVKDASADNRYFRLTNSQASGKEWDQIVQSVVSGGNWLLFNHTDNVTALTVGPTGTLTVSGLLTASAGIDSTGRLGVLGAGASNVGIYLANGTVIASGGTAYGEFLQVTLASAANNDTLYGLRILPTRSGAHTGVTQYGLFIDTVSGAATNWALYTNGSVPSQFSGALTVIGTLTAGTAGSSTNVISGTTDALEISAVSASRILKLTRTTTSAGSAYLGADNVGLNFYSGDATHRMLMTTAALSPATAGGITLGTGALPWNYLAISDGVTAPTAVSGAAFIYVDTADGDLKVRFGDGTTKTLATDT